MKPYTKAGRLALTERLSNPISDVVELDSRKQELLEIRKRTRPVKADIEQARKELRDSEDDVVSVVSDDERHKEFYSQILWDPKYHFAKLNHHAWLTELIVFMRTIFLPGISFLLPFVILIAPFILYKMSGRQINIQQYFDILQSSIKKAVPSVLGAPRFQGKGDALEMGEKVVHISVSFGMLIFNIWNQISSAIHMRKIVADMRQRALSVLRFTEATTHLATLLGQTVEIDAWSAGSMGVFGDAWNAPDRIHHLLKTAGHLDMLATLATQKRICFAELGNTVELTDLYHPSLTNRQYNSIKMSEKRHVLLTGPNRGGKSTLLKSVGVAVLMSQSVGIVFARKARLPVFGDIITALAPGDVIGKLSLFEAEIEFAKSVKARIRESSAPIFLIMDEIFHGTNAHDGVEASQIFLDTLYSSRPGVFSVISTHYMDLPVRYGEKGDTQNLCMDAMIHPADPDRILYTYKLIPGINRFSSVREILQERGLLVKTPARFPNQKNNAVSD